MVRFLFSYDKSRLISPGLYSAMFYMYIQFQPSKEPRINKRNIIIYTLGILYILSTVVFVLDITSFVVEVSKSCIHNNKSSLYTGQATTSPSDSKESLSMSRLEALSYTKNTLIGLCDFISQGILVCINLHSILTFALFILNF